MNISEKMPLFANPLEPYTGLSIADLNRYLPALQTADDLQMSADDMREGIFLTDGLTGLANRRALDQRLSHDLQTAVRSE